MLRWRLLLGVILIGLLTGLFILDHKSAVAGAWLFPLAVLLAVLLAGEMLWLLSTADQRPLPWVVYSGTLLVVASNGIPIYFANVLPPDCPIGKLGWPLLALAAGVLIAVIGEMLRYETFKGEKQKGGKPGEVIKNLALALFSMTYIGLLLSFVIQLRLAESESDSPGAEGIIALASLIVVVKLGDTGAYTVGRLIGRHKMAPVLSPSKTIEGAMGGLVFSCLGAWLALVPLANAMVKDWHPVPWWSLVVYGLVVGAAGMMGDLAESLLKRDMGRKDSSAWLPGFGGVLDLLDSILFAAPVAYICWVMGLFASIGAKH